MQPNDPFPPSDFDPWAQSYDQDVQTYNRFPFDGYERVLETVVNLAEPQPEMSVLDLGTGTGNLALRFAKFDCNLWGTDFSESMLEKAREKLPHAQFVLADLRGTWPVELDRRFDRIVSAYVFHHLELDAKVKLCSDLVVKRLAQNGRLIIADISFPNLSAMNDFAGSIGDQWEQEFYWLADESIREFDNAGLKVAYQQVSACAGVYSVSF